LDLSFLIDESVNQHIDVIAYAPYEEDLILVLTVGNVHSGSSHVVRLDGNDFSLEWSAPLFGFNIGTPVIKNRMLYVSSIGTVGKVDLQTGEYLWLHENLYDQETTDFNSFKMPVFDEEKVIFQGKTLGSCPKRIEVDDSSGKVIGIFETCGIIH
jgi:outer membrane protein assembly factor BamB